VDDTLSGHGTADREHEPFGDAGTNAALSRFLSPQPLVIVISGPSGVGKDELIAELKKRRVPLHFVVTATTRMRRQDEVDGIDYHFVSVDQFAGMMQDGELLEHAMVYGDYKGIPKQQVADALRSGKDVVLRIDVQGAQTIRRLLPDAVFIFLVAESTWELERRLIERKSEEPDKLKMRVATARRELRRVREFDYVVVNRRDRLAEAADTVLAIVDAEKHRVSPRHIQL
jgi:guanylate kinase